MNKIKLMQALQQFYIEDIGERDLTSDILFQDNSRGEITFVAKADGIFCGKAVIETGYKLMDETAEINICKQDGQEIKKGGILAVVQGDIASLLKGERVILNLVQRMSGIATNAHKASEIVKGTGIKICDTRKTTPGLRMLEKYAVTCGGGFNHRMSLSDSVMIKDNHISFAGSIAKAVHKVKEKIGHTVKVEVETETEEQVLEAVAAGADIIMFDNRKPEEIRELISLVPDGIITEASGGISFDNLAEYRNTGVHFISLGCLTHSVQALDISVKVLAK
ncbi:nicotinate-nucleotide pyrophosphorylase (carboxylating) [Peribacillus deserti]|uniref:nicotinate-nucleotide diphosphorylase (carboxylating) n=1 Tax=Peribacillus deserti TaxID=673318 RepID=A0ABS2QGF9_9BACI|nr:carboxylating nicotinate-nucleotide diphosphorylase [Peribacillus deserti]MBM7691904.1 nicotinate-nucleotide pyrophosphorylase (carboxylating) [Peribacillus deserti]